jgi:hypothetical protein
LARALGFEHARGRAAALDAIVVEIESACETEAPVEDVGGDESGRRVSAALQDGGQGRRVRREDRAAVEMDAVVRRLPPAEDRGVRGQGEGYGGQRLFEHRPPRGQRVEVWGGARLRAVGADVVRAQRVDGDEEDARARRGGRTSTPEDEAGEDGRGEHGAGQQECGAPACARLRR